MPWPRDDFFIPRRSRLDQVRYARPSACSAGGVGFYPTSGSPFHPSRIRSVPSLAAPMTHDQLRPAVFPGGRNGVHVPAEATAKGPMNCRRPTVENAATGGCGQMGWTMASPACSARLFPQQIGRTQRMRAQPPAPSPGKRPASRPFRGSPKHRARCPMRGQVRGLDPGRWPHADAPQIRNRAQNRNEQLPPRRPSKTGRTPA